jgi:hypothetical protein
MQVPIPAYFDLAAAPPSPRDRGLLSRDSESGQCEALVCAFGASLDEQAFISVARWQALPLVGTKH